MILTVLICIIYLFAGVGYYITCKDRIKDLSVRHWEKRLIMFFVILGVGAWLPLLGFAYTMTELEIYIKQKFR